MYRKQATPYLDRIQSLKALIAHGTWGPATTEADFLLVDQYIPDREYVQTCFAQAFIMAELAESMDDLFRFEKGKSASVKVRAQSFRNAISFIMEGLNRAVEKQLVDLIVMAASCYFKLSLDAIINKQWCYIIMVPLASLVKHLIVCKKECADYFTQASLLLSDLILHMLEEKDTTKAQEVLPWPTNDEYTVFLSAANQTILTSLENALSEILQHPKENNLQFIVVRNYLRHLRLNPTSKSTQIENLLQNDTIMKTFSSIHASTPTSINDTASIMKAVDNKMQQTHNCDHVFAFLLDLAEYAIKTDSSKLCKEVLEKMKLMQPSSKLNIRRELVQLQLELNESAKIESGNPHKTSYNLKRLSHAIRQAFNENVDTNAIKSSCIAAWVLISDHEDFQPHLIQSTTLVLKTLCEIAEARPSMFDVDSHCQFEYKLAKCYEHQNIFSMATSHADKALKLCIQPELANDVEILLHKLWIKANTFDGHLTAELKALSLADQAKYIPDDQVAFQLLHKALKTLVLDHELISPTSLINNNDSVLSLLQVDYAINFDIIHATETKSKRTILVAMSDIMRQSHDLAQKHEMAPTDVQLKYWKLVWDSSKYLMTLDLEKLADNMSAQKLKAEALMFQGESLLMFEKLKPYSDSDNDNAAENNKIINQAVIDPMIQSLNMGIAMKDSPTIKRAASNIWTYFSCMKSDMSPNTFNFWTETFQHLYEGLIECGMSQSNLMVKICIGYATIHKTHQDYISTQAASEKVTFEDKTPPNKGAKAPPVTEKKPFLGKSQPPIPTTSKIDDIFNTGIFAKNGSYENKLTLLDIKLSQRLAPMVLTADTDPTMKIFAILEALETKKASKDEIEQAASHLWLHGKMLSNALLFQIWLRVIQHAYNEKHLVLAYASIQELFEAFPTSCSPGYQSAAQIKPDLLFNAELLYGQIILGLIGQETMFDTDAVMRGSAIQKFSNAVELICGMHTVPFESLKQALLITDKAVSDKGAKTQIFFLHIERILSSLYSSFTAKIPVQMFISSNFDIQALIFRFTDICLMIYKSKSDWSASLRMIERTSRILPQSYKAQLLKSKVQVLSLSRKPGIELILKDADTETQFEMWSMLTGFETEAKKQKEAFFKCLNICISESSLHTKKMDVRLKYAKWVIKNSSDVSEASKLIESVLDSLQNAVTARETFSVVYVIQANVLKMQILHNQTEKLNQLTSTSDMLMKIVKPLTAIHSPGLDGKIDKAIIEAPVYTKNRAMMPNEQLTFPQDSTLKTLEGWVGYEWNQTGKDAFINGTISSSLKLSDISSPRQLISCLLYLVKSFDEFSQFQQCVPLLSLLHLITPLLLSPSDGDLLLSILCLYSAIIHSKLCYFEQAAKFRKMFLIHDNTIEHIDSLWKDNSIDHDFGIHLDMYSLLLMKADLLIQVGHHEKARTILARNIPLDYSDMQIKMIFLNNVLQWINNLNSGSFEIFKVETASSAAAFADLLHSIIKSGSDTIITMHKHLRSIIDLIDVSLELSAGMDLVAMKLWQSKYYILTNYDSDVSNEQIEVCFKQCLDTYIQLDAFIYQADHMITHSKFLQTKASQAETGREQAKNLLDALSLLQSCREWMEEKRLVDKSPHWPSLVNKAILEESELLYHIAKCGNILDVANRTLEVMLDEYFDSDGIQLPVRERWVQAQTNTIESIMENLTKNVATFEAALQCRGRLLLGMCSKVMHERYKDGDIEMASNFLRAAQSQLVRAMSIATSVSNVDIMEDCAKELLLCDVTSDEFTRLSRLCIFQSCENWKYVRQLWKDINWSTDSSLVLGAVHEANQRITVGQAHSLSFKRSQPTVLSAENIVDLPKNLKVLVLKHSDDRTRLFGAIVYRTKDVAPSKAKNPMEDFYIANASLEVDEGVLQNLVNRVQSISASALKGFVPDMNLIEDIYQYLEPILRIMEIDVSKIPEKSESKKKAAVAGKPIESDEVDRGHCVVCLDSLLEPIPIEMVLRVKNLVTSASRDFGMSFLLNRIKSSPGFAGRPMSGAPGPTLTKSDKKGQPGAIAVEKWDILKINLLANHEVPKELSGPVPSNLEFDVRVGNLNLNEIGGAFESAQVVILLDKGMTLDPSALAILSTPPHIVVSLECADFAEPLEKFNSSSKALAAYNYMNGVAFTITNACPSFPEQNYAFIRQLVKTKDVIKLKSDMSSEEIQNKRVFFGAYFVKCYGFL